jgi:cell division protein FtsQ
MPRVNRTSATQARTPRNVRDRPSRWSLLLRRQKRLLRPAVWGVAGVGAVVFVTALARHAEPGDSLSSLRERLGGMVPMRVQHIVIQGRANTPEPLLRAAHGVSPGQPTLAFSVEQARQRIETLSWVEHATVERRLPGTIVVSLTEKRPFAIWQNQGRFTLIDRDGQVVADQDLADFRHLPLVVGAGAPEHAAALLDALAKVPAVQSRVVAAVRVGERRWNLHLNNGADVLLPEGAESAALTKLMELQASIALLDRPLQLVDMRLPDRLVIRPAAAPPPAAGHADPHGQQAPAKKSTMNAGNPTGART